MTNWYAILTIFSGLSGYVLGLLTFAYQHRAEFAKIQADLTILIADIADLKDKLP